MRRRWGWFMRNKQSLMMWISMQLLTTFPTTTNARLSFVASVIKCYGIWPVGRFPWDQIQLLKNLPEWQRRENDKNNLKKMNCSFLHKPMEWMRIIPDDQNEQSKPLANHVNRIRIQMCAEPTLQHKTICKHNEKTAKNKKMQQHCCIQHCFSSFIITIRNGQPQNP